VLAASRPDKSRQKKANRWWHLHWNGLLVPAVSALAGAVAVTVGFLAAQLLQTAPVTAATFRLSAVPGQAGSATAVARVVSGGYQIQLNLARLPRLRPGQFHECAYVGSGGELVSGGTFTASNGSVSMQSAANPGEFTVVQIRREQPGVGVDAAPVILTGAAQPG
jgi:hypothetical protein